MIRSKAWMSRRAIGDVCSGMVGCSDDKDDDEEEEKKDIVLDGREEGRGGGDGAEVIYLNALI